MTPDAVSSNGPDRQSEIDAQNRRFWDELCGTALAKSLGVTDSSPPSLARFDKWYLDFYPYLLKHVPVELMAGKRVLEIGLGYGTLSQKIAEAGAIYSGLDIAAGPVAMVNQRLSQSGLSGKAVQGSVLEAPFGDGEFDWVVSIGCLHHTGNLQRALDECWRLLKPGGQAAIMVYSAYSYRQWFKQPLPTLRQTLAERGAASTPVSARTDAQRAAYDASTKDGTGAPETAFTSAAAMRRLARRWSHCKVTRENIGQESIFRFLPRDVACRMFGPVLGLDLYCRLTK
jgi:SAM-dependent methyltransferase